VEILRTIFTLKTQVEHLEEINYIVRAQNTGLKFHQDSFKKHVKTKTG
jgi:hypothetical protein